MKKAITILIFLVFGKFLNAQIIAGSAAIGIKVDTINLFQGQGFTLNLKPLYLNCDTSNSITLTNNTDTFRYTAGLSYIYRSYLLNVDSNLEIANGIIGVGAWNASMYGAYRINQGVVIGQNISNSTWISTDTLLFNALEHRPLVTQYWDLDFENKYIPIRKKYGSEYLYGWIHATASSLPGEWTGVYGNTIHRITKFPKLKVIYDTMICTSMYTFLNGFTMNGIWKDTVYNFTIPSSTPGCDSLVRTKLTLLNTSVYHNYDTVCAGISYQFPDSSILANTSQDTVHVNRFTRQNGCDSLIVSNLKVVHNTRYDTITVCKESNYTFPDGQSISNIYQDTSHLSLFTAYNGCDSNIHSRLIIAPHSSSKIVKACTEYFFNNQSLTSSGVYLDTLTNLFGCDSIVTLNLTILPTSITTKNETACNVYYFNGQTLTASGIYYDTLINQNGCDSVIILNLSINPISNSTEDIKACNHFYFNGQDLSNSGVYNDTLVNQYGCDSLITLNLNIQKVDTGVSQHGIFLSSHADSVNYQWLSCNPYRILPGFTSQQYTALQNGEYAVELNLNGCADTSECITIGYVNNDEIVIVPNPATNYIDVFYRFNLFVEQVILMYNTLGQIVYEEKITSKKPGTRIDIDYLPVGVYYVKCGNTIMKVLKQ